MCDLLDATHGVDFGITLRGGHGFRSIENFGFADVEFDRVTETIVNMRVNNAGVARHINVVTEEHKVIEIGML
jgi:hypothetical protein